ncbi:MAG TPA: T9SS type A sorting domain-containing protein, partial [Flavitalea sp.]|nr:T9SS type A sorting domain-containing protein [Flavitalea sp.]
KAQGNSTVKVNYSYNDILKGESVMSYRLKIVDQDETFAYSPIKTVKTEGGLAEMKIFPNPATEYVVITAKNNANKMNVQLINLNGQILKQTNGNGNIQMSVNGVNAGSYVLRVTDATGTAQSFKLMIN